MTPSDPKRSKEITTPRRNVLPTTPSRGKEKTASKIMEPTVIVAIISAVVTLITALLSSPVLLALVNKTPTEIPSEAQSVAEMGMSGTLIPGVAPSTPTERLVKTIVDPTETATAASGPSPTSEQLNTLPTATLTAPPLATTPPLATATDLPPTPDIPAPSLFSCLTVDVWFPYPSTLNPAVTAGCWNLADWGFSSDQGNLFLIHNPGVDQQRGIYLPISGDVVIQFTFLLNEFRSHSNKGGFLHFGIVQDDPFSNYNGGYLSYQQPSPGATSPIRVLVSGTNQATQTLLILEKGFQQVVVLSVKGDWLTVFLDGAPAGEPVRLPLTNRAFWVGYVLPGKAELDVRVTGFSIQPP